MATEEAAAEATQETPGGETAEAAPEAVFFLSWNLSGLSETRWKT